LDHSATKGIQIAGREKVTAVVRGVENGARTFVVGEDKDPTTEDTRELTGENPGAAGKYAESCKLGVRFHFKRLAECGLRRLFLPGSIAFIPGVGYAYSTFAVRPWND
jgi:hypothetical protein